MRWHHDCVKKTAPAQFPILPELADRWSPVAFSPRAVESEKLQRIFEAARWAPSSSNEQPWSFVAATSDDPEAFERLADCLVPGNAWARKAPVLALSVARTVFAGTATPNRHAFHDTGMAVGNLLAQATAEGLMVHQMAGYDVEKARRNLSLPANHEPVAMIAIGYYGEPTPAQREREERPRTRKPIDQFVFSGRWGKPLW
ncbi:MAG: Nitroreductase [Bryobacterales bacterium]|nr:Nitroreductase [Bryobacterales bacterium]